MCVIAYADEARPTEDMIERMWNNNPNGAGIAWRRGDKVCWKKGLELLEAQELAAKVPLPYVVHFRTPSGGTSRRPACCHPFPLTDDVSLAMEGSLKGYVLFHNGMWGGWKDKLVEYSLRSGKKLPGDSWSDSRGLAWVGHHFGFGILELINEKVIVFGPADYEMFGGWETVKIGDKLIWVSNKFWEKRDSWDKDRLPAHYGGNGGTADHTPFCRTAKAEDAIRPGGNRQESLSKGAEASSEVGGKAGEEGESLKDWVRNLNPSNTRRALPPHRGCSKCGSWQVFDDNLCYPCWDDTSRKRAVQVVDNGTIGTLYTCRKCTHTFRIVDVKYMGLDSSQRPIWHCLKCISISTPDQDREKHEKAAKDNIEIVGGL